MKGRSGHACAVDVAQPYLGHVGVAAASGDERVLAVLAKLCGIQRRALALEPALVPLDGLDRLTRAQIPGLHSAPSRSARGSPHATRRKRALRRGTHRTCRHFSGRHEPVSTVLPTTSTESPATWGPKMLRTLWPTRMSHTCTVLSHPPLTSRFSSSGQNLSENTRLLWPAVTLGMLQQHRARQRWRQAQGHGSGETMLHSPGPPATRRQDPRRPTYPPLMRVTRLLVASSYTRTDRSLPAVANSAPSGR